MKIAIVNDMQLALEALRRVIALVPEYEIVWVAKDGMEAVTKCAANTPDLILMDLVMPMMDGVEATRQIMAQSPCAILLVTAGVNELAAQIFAAMGHGALDVVSTPILGTMNSPEGGSSLLTKIATIGKLLGKSSKRSTNILFQKRPVLSSNQLPPLIVIGASTGGPQAIAKLLSPLSSDFQGALIIVQHVDAQFAPSFADWLNNQTSLPVSLVTPGRRPEAGQVWVTGTNDHLIMRANCTLSYTPNPASYAYRPSVDVFFESLAQYWPEPGLAILLTGMGRDGAAGMGQLKAAKWHTIAQNKASCVVYGMPKAAAELGAAMEILPIEAITQACIRFQSQSKNSYKR